MMLCIIFWALACFLHLLAALAAKQYRKIIKSRTMWWKSTDALVFKLLLPFLAATYPSPACGQTPIQLRDLPPPPPELEEWIKRGNVVFEHAGSPAKQDPKSSGGGAA